MLETILSCCLNMFCRSLKCVPAISRKDIVKHIDDKHVLCFVDRW